MTQCKFGAMTYSSSLVGTPSGARRAFATSRFFRATEHGRRPCGLLLTIKNAGDVHRRRLVEAPEQGKPRNGVHPRKRRDIKPILGAESGNIDEKKLKVRDAFVEQPCIVSASAPVGKVAKMMAERHIGSAIVTKNDKLVGIFTVTDACRALAQVLGENEEESERVA